MELICEKCGEKFSYTEFNALIPVFCDNCFPFTSGKNRFIFKNKEQGEIFLKNSPLYPHWKMQGRIK